MLSYKSVLVFEYFVQDRCVSSKVSPQMSLITFVLEFFQTINLNSNYLNVFDYITLLHIVYYLVYFVTLKYYINVSNFYPLQYLVDEPQCNIICYILYTKKQKSLNVEEDVENALIPQILYPICLLIQILIMKRNQIQKMVRQFEES